MKCFPVCLTGLGQKRTLVIGGGRVADRKVRALLEAGASLTLISPALVPELEQLTEENSIPVYRRAYRTGDLEGAFLVIAATDDAALNRSIWQEAEGRGCLINVVDDPQHSNFIFPAVVRRGDFVLAVSTGGASPALARRVREQLETQFGPEYGELARLLAELRPELLARMETPEARAAAVLALLEAGLLADLQAGGYEAVKTAVEEKWAGQNPA